MGFIVRIVLLGLLMVGCGQRDHRTSGRTAGGESEGTIAEDVVESSAGTSPQGPEAPLEEPGGQQDDPCDLDGDGFYDTACGGDDCNDSVASIHPGAQEICSFYDENCDEVINDGIDCRVYAHTANQLYLVEPFIGQAELIGAVPSILDFDTDREGNLYGITTSSLYEFNTVDEGWSSVGGFGGMDGSTNGFAINSMSEGFATSGNSLYRIDLTSGDAVLVGTFGHSYKSSGDCVVDKSDRLFFSSDHDLQTDHLVVVDTATGEGSAVGPIGFRDVYGLTAAWGSIFGFTGSGEIITIDPSTGAGQLLHEFEGRSWWGAASSPSR